MHDDSSGLRMLAQVCVLSDGCELDDFMACNDRAIRSTSPEAQRTVGAWVCRSSTPVDRPLASKTEAQGTRMPRQATRQ